MQHLRSALLGALLVLQACQAQGSLQVRADGTPKPAAKPSTAAPKATPSAPAPASVAAPPAALAAAPGTAVLKGSIKVDASYGVLAGGGRVVANHGGEAIAFADASLISNNAGNLIANNGGSVLAQWGAALISDNGALLISDKGSGLISDNGHAYRLQQAAPLVGAILPAAGMLVGVVDLRTGALQPIGQGPDGKPVYAAYSDADGGYALHLPTSLAANVAVVAVPPAAPKVDKRLSFDLVTAPRGESAAIDEDTALASRFMRDFLTGNVYRALIAKGPSDITIKTTAIGAELKTVIEAFFTEVNGEAIAVGLQKAPDAEVQRVARRISDTVLAQVDLPAVKISQALSPRWTKGEAPALPAMVEVLRACRERATEVLRADPGFAAKQPYLIEANAALPEAERYVIAKPADFGDFIVQEYLLTARRPSEGIDNVFASLGAGETLADGANSRRIEIEAGVLAISGGIVGALIANQGGAHDEAIAVVRGWKP